MTRAVEVPSKMERYLCGDYCWLVQYLFNEEGAAWELCFTPFA